MSYLLSFKIKKYYTYIYVAKASRIDFLKNVILHKQKEQQHFGLKLRKDKM